MTKEINLLPLESRIGGKRNRSLAVFRWISAVSLILVLALSIATFLLNYYSPLTGLKEQQASLLAEFDSLNNKAAKYLYLKDRLIKIKNILDSRKSLYKESNYILTGLPVDVTLGSLSISKNDVKVSASAYSLTSLNTFMMNMVKLSEGKKIFSKVTLDSLGVDTLTGRYSLSLSMIFL